VFAYALHHLKSHALMELSDQTGSDVAIEDVRWVVTVPAIWKQPAKQFMREAAYQVKACSCQRPYCSCQVVPISVNMPVMCHINYYHSRNILCNNHSIIIHFACLSPIKRNVVLYI
jgi:hypothetical protein